MDAQEARIYVAIIISVIVVGVIIIYFALSVIRQQRRNLELQKANALAEITAMEKERARIAADLHDDLGPVLSVIKFRVDHVELVEEEEKRELEKASAQLDDVIARMREVANNLMPSALQRKGLVTAISEFISNAEGGSGVRILFDHPDMPGVDENKSINIYRIVQEVVHNCLKHAKASRLDIHFGLRQEMLTITCRDNGVGFDPVKTSRESEGIGLRSLRNRTAMMDGNLTIETKKGKGTIFLFEIPMK